MPYPQSESREEGRWFRYSPGSLSLEEKVAAIEAELRKWDVDADRVRRLAEWDWIKGTLNQVPHPNPIAA